MISGFYYTEEEEREAEELDRRIESLEDDNFLHDLHSYDAMCQIAKCKIDEGVINVALHILEALWDVQAEYYLYDVTSGTIETPVPIDNIEELEKAREAYASNA